jgi:hypothetical protein
MKKRQLKWVVAGLILLAIIVVAIIIWRRFNAPAAGTINNPPVTQTQPKTYGTKNYQGKQVAFAADERYSLKVTSQGAAGLDSFVFTFSGGTTYKKLAVAVDNLPQGGLGEYPSYQTRLIHAEAYKKSTKTVSNSTYQVFSATNGTEMTAFGVRGGQVVSISITSGQSEASIAGDLDQVLASLHWQ